MEENKKILKDIRYLLIALVIMVPFVHWSITARIDRNHDELKNKIDTILVEERKYAEVDYDKIETIVKDNRTTQETQEIKEKLEDILEFADETTKPARDTIKSTVKDLLDKLND